MCVCVVVFFLDTSFYLELWQYDKKIIMQLSFDKPPLSENTKTCEIDVLRCPETPLIGIVLFSLCYLTIQHLPHHMQCYHYHLP